MAHVLNLVGQFVSVTGAQPNVAAAYLAAFHNHLELAIANYFENPHRADTFSVQAESKDNHELMRVSDYGNQSDNQKSNFLNVSEEYDIESVEMNGDDGPMRAPIDDIETMLVDKDYRVSSYADASGSNVLEPFNIEGEQIGQSVSLD